MDQEWRKEVEAFLPEMKILVSEGKRELVNRKSRDKLQDMLILDLEGEAHLWNIILELKFINSNKPPELDHNGSGEKVFFFLKIMPNGTTAYIKLKLGTRSNRKVCVCLSFHPTTSTTSN